MQVKYRPSCALPSPQRVFLPLHAQAEVKQYQHILRQYQHHLHQHKHQHQHQHQHQNYYTGGLQSWLPPCPLPLVVDLQQLAPAQHRRQGLCFLLCFVFLFVFRALTTVCLCFFFTFNNTNQLVAMELFVLPPELLFVHLILPTPTPQNVKCLIWVFCFLTLKIWGSNEPSIQEHFSANLTLSSLVYTPLRTQVELSLWKVSHSCIFPKFLQTQVVQYNHANTSKKVMICETFRIMGSWIAGHQTAKVGPCTSSSIRI